MSRIDIKTEGDVDVYVNGVQVRALIDLSLWKLTLPIDAAGGYTGKAIEYKPIPPTLQNEWFSQGYELQFRVPVEGATTSGSKYPRCELRELNADGSLAGWTVEQGGVLKAGCAVTELPAKQDGMPGRVVIGQIHGPDDELCRLYFDQGRLYFYNDKATYGTGYKELKFDLKSITGQLSAIPLGELFTYEIKVSGGFLIVEAVHNGARYSAAERISTFWPGKPCYFKAGCYCQVGKPGSGAGTIGSGQASVTLSNVAVTHA